MIKYHIEDENNRIVTVDSFPDNDKCWIQMIDPTDDELREITMRFDLPMEACRAALDLLLEESKLRQILLFTCQHRESAYLAGRDGVTLLSL